MNEPSWWHSPFPLTVASHLLVQLRVLSSMSPANSMPQVGICSPNDETSMSSIDDNIFETHIEKDDPLWKTYIEESNLFDKNMIDEWNKIIDVILVFVALFISVLTAFVINTSAQFQRDPADITNDLLVAIYKQLSAQSNNTTAPTVDPASFFVQNRSDHSTAVFYNALLYCSLALSILVSAVALVAKLWLVNYSHRVFSFGSPYERAMRRQEAYNGVLVWNMNATINALPIALIVALAMFALFISASVHMSQKWIGLAVGAIIVIGLVAIAVVSIVAAFVPSCPYRSSVTDAIHLVFAIIDCCLRLTRCHKLPPTNFQRLRSAVLVLLCLATGVWTPIVTLRISSAYYSLVCFPIMIAYAVVMKREYGNHKSQQYRLPMLVALSYLIIVPIICVSGIFRNPKESHLFIGLYSIGAFLFILSSAMVIRMSKSMAATGEIDAISWLLRSTSSQHASLFRKAGQIANKPGYSEYNSRFLESLYPLLSPLISSHHADNDSHFEDLEIYTSCLARLSDFTDFGGSILLLKEDARSHPPLDEPLRAKLVKLTSSTRPRLRSSSLKILHNYGLNKEGERENIAKQSTLPRYQFSRTEEDLKGEKVRTAVNQV